MLFPFYKSLLIYRRDDREVFIALQYRGRGAWGCRENYKQAGVEHVRGGAKTKDVKLRQKTRGC